MNATLSSVSTEHVSAVLVVATTIAVMSWFTTDLSGVSRLATAGLSFASTAIAMTVGLYFLN